MPLLNMSAGGRWNTSYNTAYSNATAHTTSSPYYYNVSTSWNFTTSWSSVTSYWTGVISNTSNVTTYGTQRETSSACVEVSSFIYGGLFAENVSVGDTLKLADEKTLEPGTGKVSYSETKDADGFELATENGAVLVCSSTAPIPTTEGIVLAPNVLGKSVGTWLNGVVAWNKVVSVKSVGRIKVQHITVGDKCFWAGKEDGKFILHHNIKEGGGGGLTYYDTYFDTSYSTVYATGTSFQTYFWTSNSQITTTTFLTSYYTAGYYTTSYSTSYNVITNRITGSV